MIFTAIAGGATALYGLGKGAGWWGQAPKVKYKKTAGERAYEDLLDKRSREGALSTGVRFNMLNQASRQASNARQNERIASEGTSLFQGTRGVVSRERQKVGDENLYRSLVEGSLEIENANELSKIKAQDMRGDLSLKEGQARRDLNYKNAMNKYQAQQSGWNTAFSGLNQLAGGLDDMFGKQIMDKLGIPQETKASLETALGKNPADLSPEERGFILATKFSAKDPDIWEGIMMQYDPENKLGLWNK